MNVKNNKKKHLIEESVESKPHSYVEPTTFSNEVKNLWRDMIDTTKQDVLAGSLSSVTEQLLGTGNELREGQEVSLAQQQAQYAQKKAEEVEKTVVSAEHMEYFRPIQNADKIGETRTEQQVGQAVEEIRMEIKRLVNTSKLVERTVKDATADKAPVKPGKYHINFFQFVLSMLRDATRKLEDSVSYGSLFTSRKQQSKYWNSYKSHGTSFGLSGERSTATQTG